MADSGLRRVVPSDLYPLVLGFLRDNQLSEVANKFAKATGAVSRRLGHGLRWGGHRVPALTCFGFQVERSVGSASPVSAGPSAVTRENLAFRV